MKKLYKEYEIVRAAKPEAWRIDINIANAQAQLSNFAAALEAVERVLTCLHAEEGTTQFPRTDDLAYCHEMAAELSRVRGDLAASERHYRAAVEYAPPNARPQLQDRLDAVSHLRKQSEDNP